MLLVKNLLLYPIFRDFQLVSGHKGLTNEVTGTAIFEWESPEDVDKTFEEGEFVMTTLLKAKDDPEYAEKCLEILILKRVSAIAIKKVYFNEISESLKSFSNHHNVPIFFFSDIYFDDIIFTIKSALTYNTMNTYYEEKINKLLDPSINPLLSEKIAKEINPTFYNNLICCYATLKDSIHDDLDHYYRSLFNINHKDVHYSYSVIKYKQGLLIIYTNRTDTIDLKSGLMNFLDSMGFNTSNFIISLSSSHHHLNELGKAIKESIYTYASSLIDNTDFQDFDSLGLDKLLMPIRNEGWVLEYYNNFYEKISEYDAYSNTDFFNTLLDYIQYDGDLQLVAKKNFLHVNTIRYRIKKMKEILNIGESADSFHQLYVFVRLYHIYNNLLRFNDL